MSKFIKHEPCPRCNSIDNLARYDDGGAYCFGCKYYEKSSRWVSEHSHLPTSSKKEFDLTDRIPQKPLEWLKKYGITDEEIQSYSIRYSQRYESLVIPLGDSGTVTTRYFGTDSRHPKSLTFGQRSHNHFFGNQGVTGTCVLVEDIISGIKVARWALCYTILGSDIPRKPLRIACKLFSKVRIWLDRDMATKALKTASRASLMYNVDCKAIITDLDPKDYSNEEIRSMLARS